MPSDIPNGFTDSWYVKTQRDITALQVKVAHLDDGLKGIAETLNRIDRRQNEQARFMAQVAVIGIVAALLIPTVPEWIQALDNPGRASSVDARRSVTPE